MFSKAAKSECCDEANEQTEEGEEENTDHNIYLSFHSHDKRMPTDGGLEAGLPGPGLFRLREDVRRDLAGPSLFMYNGLDFRVKAVESRIKTGFTRWNKST